MKNAAKSVVRLIIVGIVTLVFEFMFALIHGWPIPVIFAITATMFLAAGILATQWNHKTHWYSGLLLALPFLSLFYTGRWDSEIALLPLAGLVAAYIGSFISPYVKLATKVGVDQPERLRILFTTGVLCLVPPLVNWVLWIHTFSTHPDLTPQEKTGLFLAYFPAFLQNIRVIFLLGLVFSAVSVLLSSMVLNQISGWPKVTSICVVMLGGLVAFSQLYSML